MRSYSKIDVDLDVHKAIEAKRSSFDQSKNDILREVFSLPPIRSGARKKVKAKKERVSGSFQFTYKGHRFEERSLKSAYKRILLVMQRDYPSFLAKLSEQETRARRIVARRPDALYKNSPELAELAEILIGDWWVDVNLSTEQVMARVRIACDVAGLKFGKDLIIDF